MFGTRSHFSGRFFVTCFGTAFGIALLAGCNSTQRHGGASAPAPPPDIDQLRQRVVTLWDARVAEDWATTFRFESPETQAGATAEEYAAWKDENEPFIVLDYDIEAIEAVDGLGWATVAYQSKLRKFEKLPPRNSTRDEKWYAHQGQWYPVPGAAADRYPAAPAKRDADAEAHLGERHDAAWRARQAGDIRALYEFILPADRQRVSQDQFMEEESRLLYLSRKVHWVEAIDDVGRVRVAYEYRFNDPSMTKMTPQWLVITENWAHLDGQWYLDIDAADQATKASDE